MRIFYAYDGNEGVMSGRILESGCEKERTNSGRLRRATYYGRLPTVGNPMNGKLRCATPWEYNSWTEGGRLRPTASGGGYGE